MKSLVPCPSCQRHVRATESACPFCHAGLPESLASAVVPGASQRMKRAAAFAFTASLAIAGCGDTTTPAPRPDAAADTPAADTPAADVPAVDRPSTDGPADDGSVMALYGVPADVPSSDVSSPDAGPSDDGSVMALYGAVPADVAQDDGGGGVRYGAPPAEGWA